MLTRERLPRGLMAAACAVLVLGLPFCALGAEAPLQSGDPARGKQLYYSHGCYECHGYNGETGVRRLVGTDSPLIREQSTFIAFLRLRAGVGPMIPAATMPSFPPTALSDAQARDIFAYIRTFVLHAPNPSDIPALQKAIESAQAPYKPAR